ncbi:HEAT repeat domain-containing protein, partial [Verrucomicrobiota bacterium]
QNRAAAALTAIGASSVGRMAELVDDKDSATALRAMGFLGNLGADAGGALPVLRPNLQGKDWPRAIAAASALVSIAAAEEQAVSDAMIKGLSDPRVNVVTDAAAILARIAQETEDDRTRQRIVKALAGNLSGRSAGGDELSGRATGGEFKRALLQALGQIGPAAKSAVPALEKLGADPVVSKDVLDAWQKIVPGKPMPKPKVDEELELELDL